MKTYIYYYQIDGKTFTTNLCLKSKGDALLIAWSTGFEYVGENYIYTDKSKIIN